MQLNLPNLLTILRVLIIPLLVLCFYLPWPGMRQLAAGLFVLASLTDWLDGYLARRWNQTSRFGAFLDPVADKLLVAVALVMLLAAEPGSLLAVLVAIIIGREITISALREWMAELGERTRVAVGWIGKVKTAMQMIAIACMLYDLPLFQMPMYPIGFVLLGVAVVLTVWSMCIYLMAAWPLFREHP